jgi:hypothetical protein
VQVATTMHWPDHGTSCARLAPDLAGQEVQRDDAGLGHQVVAAQAQAQA